MKYFILVLTAALMISCMSQDAFKSDGMAAAKDHAEHNFFNCLYKAEPEIIKSNSKMILVGVRCFKYTYAYVCRYGAFKIDCDLTLEAKTSVLSMRHIRARL